MKKKVGQVTVTFDADSYAALLQLAGGKSKDVENVVFNFVEDRLMEERELGNLDELEGSDE